MPRKRKLKPEEEKSLLILKSSYEMQLKAKEAALLRGKDDSVERMDIIINDTLKRMADIDPSFAKKCAEENSDKDKKTNIDEIINSNNLGKTVFDSLEELDVREEKYEKINEPTPKTDSIFNTEVKEDNSDLYELADKVEDSFQQKIELAEQQIKADETIYNNVDPLAQYDLIPLPSNGECYKLKIDRVPVGYLTAADENLITSPNLYESGSITNILLKKKILNKDINVDNLVSGDVDAIMLFLRGTSYGNDFPITVKDPRTGKTIETNVDLSKLKYKPFNLKADENGHFDFVLPRTGVTVKFKFLTKKEENLLQKLNKNENKGIASFELAEAVEKVNNALKSDKTLNLADRNIIIDANSKIEKWAKSLKENGQTIPYSRAVTNTMEMELVSVDGNTDKSYIHDFVMNMPASDSLALRRYIYDNQPGVNFEVEVQRPESMGGGSFKCFLEWNDSIFWNIA